MPFTPSHAVVALVFRNSPIPASAVAVGAVVPDLGLYLPVTRARESTHSLLGIVTVDLLLGAVGLLLWTVLLAPAWRDLSPWIVRARLKPPAAPPRDVRAIATWLLLAATGLVTGSATHVLWDGFTHAGGPFVAAIPFLQAEFGPFTGYKWAQYGSGVLGLLGLGIAAGVWYIGRRPRIIEADDHGEARLAAWTVVLVAAIVPAGVVLVGTGLDPFEEAYRPYVVDAAVLMVGWTATAAVVVALLWRLVVRPAPRRQVDPDPS